MSVIIKSQNVYMGAGLIRKGWVVLDNDVPSGWLPGLASARLRALELEEQKEHRDGA